VNSGIKWGLIIAVFSFLWIILEKNLGYHTSLISEKANFSWLSIPLTLVLYYLAFREVKRKLKDEQSIILEYLKTGLIIGVITMIFAPISMWLMSTYISPDFFSNAIAEGVRVGEDRTKLESEYNLRSFMLKSSLAAIVLGIFLGIVSVLMEWFRTLFSSN